MLTRCDPNINISSSCSTRKLNRFMCLPIQARPVESADGSVSIIKGGLLCISETSRTSKQPSKQETAISKQASYSYCKLHSSLCKSKLYLKMVATVTKFSFTATLVCVAMLWHGSLQMPTHARTRRSSICDRKLQLPNVERDLVLGLYTMYRLIFTNARSVSISTYMLSVSFRIYYDSSTCITKN